MSTFLDLFPGRPPLIGMVHLLPLPGAPRHDGGMAPILDRALRDAAILAEEGYDAVLVENYGDVPFLPGRVDPETVAAMAVVAERIGRACGLPLGVNVLRNDARSALAVALAAGGRFIRVNVHTGVTGTDQGLLEGRAHETLRERARLGARVLILADVLVKHGRPLSPADPALAARDAVARGLADGLLVTGAATGSAPDRDRLREVHAATPGTPVLVASGLTAKNAGELLPLADGAVVGTAIERGGRSGAPVDRRRARSLARVFRSATA